MRYTKYRITGERCGCTSMTEQPIAGWYPDGSGNDRYWNGAAWTEHVRPVEAGPLLTSATIEPADKNGVFSKLGSAVKKAADDRKSAKEELARAHAERELAAGRLLTSGVFGTSTIEIYEGGFVRVAVVEGGRTPASGVAEITRSTPYERLRSITFASPESATSDAGATSQIEGAVMQAMSGIVRGGKILAKSTAIGLATTGLAQLAKNAAIKSNLVIATDTTIHTLTNQQNKVGIKLSVKEHDAVALALVEAGNSALGIDTSVAHEALEIAPVPSIPAVSATPTLSERIRELSGLHVEGILSDEEFGAAKAKLLSGL